MERRHHPRAIRLPLARQPNERTRLRRTSSTTKEDSNYLASHRNNQRLKRRYGWRSSQKIKTLQSSLGSTRIRNTALEDTAKVSIKNERLIISNHQAMSNTSAALPRTVLPKHRRLSTGKRALTPGLMRSDCQRLIPVPKRRRRKVATR
jgi:hypothetical protein